MPTITTSFIDFLMYIAPGFVLLYSLRGYFHGIDKLIGSGVQPPPTLEALVPLLLMTIAAGVLVKALSEILLRILGFIGRGWKRRPKEQRIALYRSILRHEAEKLHLFNSYVRSMQTNAAMATALVISLGSMVYHHFSGDQSMSGFWAKFSLVSVFTFAMLAATALSLGTLRDVMQAFSPSPEEKTDAPKTG
jgi:hypothetical protein